MIGQSATKILIYKNKAHRLSFNGVQYNSLNS